MPLVAACTRVVSDLARVGDGIEEVRAHGRLAAGELHGHLAARLDLERVVENFLNFLPAQFVNVANLVGVHEAGIAHHVAAVGEVDGKNRAAAIANGRRAVLVQVFVVVRGNIAAGELLFNPVEELGVDGHHVFVVAVQRAILDHPDLTVALDDLRLNLADLLVHQVAPIFFAGDDRFARFFHASGAERIGLAREAKRRLGLFPGLQQRLIRPLRRNGRIGIALVEVLNGVKRVLPQPCKPPNQRSLRSACLLIRHKPLPSTFKNA